MAPFSPAKSPLTKAHIIPPIRSEISPSLIYRTKCATNQMPCTNSVQDSRNPTDTPGPSKPDETRPRKSYLAALTSEAARTSPAGPLGFDTKNWPPLASMAIDPPPKLFVRPKDRVPPTEFLPLLPSNAAAAAVDTTNDATTILMHRHQSKATPI